MRSIALEQHAFVISNDPQQLLAELLQVALTDPEYDPQALFEIFDEGSDGYYVCSKMNAYRIELDEELPENPDYTVEDIADNELWHVFREASLQKKAESIILVGYELRYLFRQALALLAAKPI